MEKTLEINSKVIHIMKPLTNANYKFKTVLTNSSWEYVELWLKRNNRNKTNKALFYWKQAYDFFKASECLPLESKPLTAYYCCLNATKALLAANCQNKIDLDNIRHGIHSSIDSWETTNMRYAKVKFQDNGVLYELSVYLNEDSQPQEYSIYDILYNIACIHRTFSLTYDCTELFIPIKDISFIINSETSKGCLQFQTEPRYANRNSLKYLPKSFKNVPGSTPDKYYIRSIKQFDWNIHDNLNNRLKNISDYHSGIRKDIHYIYGNTRLWYIKKDIPTNKHILKRNSLTLIFAAMHWLSELARYNPEKFHSIMNSKQNWLIHEFVETALYHFIDEISCEIAHVDIMSSGFRK